MKRDIIKEYENTLECLCNRFSMAWLRLFMEIAFAIKSEWIHGIFSKKYDKRLEFERERIKELQRFHE